MTQTVLEAAPAVSPSEKRALLAKKLRQATERESRRPLSFAQERMWFLHQLEPNSALYNVPLAVSISGTLDAEALQKALLRVAHRHHVLRTRIETQDGAPTQIVSSQFNLRWQAIKARTEADAEQLAREDARRTFDLTGGEAPIRATLIHISPENHLLTLNLHHIAADEWSLKILFRDLAELYAAQIEQREPELPRLPIQYADYASWQRSRQGGFENHINYWRAQFAETPLVTELLTDRPRGKTPTFAGGVARHEFGKDLRNRLAKIGADQNATLFMVLLAGFKALVSCYTGLEDIVIGSPVAGRGQLETEDLIGFFVNTLLLRTTLAGDPTFTELLHRVRATALGAFEHDEAPFEKVVEALHPERSLRPLAFTNIMFALQAPNPQRIALPGATMSWKPIDTETAKFDVTLVMQDSENGLAAHVEYNSDLFDGSTIERLLRHFENLLRGAADEPTRQISELPLLDETEKSQLLIDWNNNATEYPRDATIHELFEAQAEENRDSIAIVFGSEVLTYGELNARANQLARHLLHQGVNKGELIGLCVERSADMVIGMLAILKAGCAYAPLDPHYPKERLNFMLNDTKAAIVLTQKRLAGRLPRGIETVCLDAMTRSQTESAENPAPRATSEDLAYVIYTSGSTGEPKGVPVPHQAVNRLVLNTNYIELNSTDRIAQVSNISFDAATFEVWGALLNGGQLRGIATEIALAPDDFATELKKQGITAMFLTSALFSQVAAEHPSAFTGMRTLIAGGEALEPKAVRAVLAACPALRLVNGYGPTENTTFTCCAPLRDISEHTANVPIGTPIANTQVYILNKHRQLAPIGAPGELYTGGDGLARGYWNRPELTAENFVSHRFSADEPCHRLYRTGDLARWLPNGTIEFLGRADNQIKIRGFRVELEEIETHLAAHPAVQQCVIKASNAGPMRLIAYFVSNEKRTVKTSQLRAHLTERLPEYMVPAAFAQLESLPLTPNGKLDRRALPEPDSGTSAREIKYAAPRDAVEAELANIWENVLDVRPIGIEDNFFELGGHSLLAARVALQAEKALGRKLRLATIFTSPTIEKLAATLRDEIRQAGATAETSLVELQPKGEKPPLFLVHGAGGGMFWGYVNLARQLDVDQPVYGFGSRGMDGRAEFESIQEMAAQYVRDLRAFQPHGPYSLGGYCFGGNVAYEMARQIKEQGEEVALLALLNCAPPNTAYMRARWTPKWAVRFGRNLIYWWSYCRQWTEAQRRDFIRWKWRQFKTTVVKRFVTPPASDAPADVDGLIDLSSIPEQERELWQTHIRALRSFRPQRYPGKVHLFRSPGHPLWCSFEPDYGWGELAQAVHVTIVPGTHEKILEEPWVADTAVEMKKVIAAQQVEAAQKISSQHSLIDQWNKTEKEFPRDKTLFQLFAEQVDRTPTAEALVCGVKRFTYRELADHAAKIASELYRLGVGNESLVGICLERSEDLVAAILGTLQAGGAYVPLDPAYPRARLEIIAQDAKLRALVTREKLRDLIAIENTPVFCVDNADTTEAKPSPPSDAQPANLAYVLYTSGSTGKPKGVALEHRSAVAFVSWAKGVFSAEEISGVLAATSICFDLSIFELFVPLCWGGKVILADNALALPSLPARNEVTLINTVPSAIRELVRIQGIPPSVSVVNLAGEPLATELVDQIYRGTSVQKVYDLYGPTETTTYSTFTLRRPEEPATIGRPLANEQAYVLDEQMRQTPVGVAGDLYIGGAGLARGYLHRPDLTAERFVPHPFKKDERIYKTGDIARWREDGNLIYMGRSDHQVKIRGFRIELGEIEFVLKSHPGVSEVVVIGREDRPGEKRLAAYVVTNNKNSATAGELKRLARDKLPDYMTPAAFVFLPKLPLTPNGKVDRLALPAPTEESRNVNENFTPPQTATEREVATIWREVLGVKNVSATDDFFELGGHSLLVIQVVSRLRTNLGVEAPLSSLYDNRTVRALAAAVETAPRQNSADASSALRPIDRKEKLPASFMQEQLWFLHGLAPESDAYNVAVAIRLKGPLDRAALQRSLDSILARHEALRTTFHFQDGALTQKINAPAVLKIEFIDAPKGSDNLAREKSRAPFDLEHGPLFRASVISTGSGGHILVLAMHHAVSDGWSLDILFRELETNYRAFAGGQSAPSLPPISIQSADFAAWQRDWMQSPRGEEELNYWRKKLAGAPQAIELPHDEPGTMAPTTRAGRRAIVLDRALVAGIAKLSHREAGTTFMVLLTGLTATLQKWTDQSDMVIGTVVAGRNYKELEGAIGCFMNFLPLRINASEEQTTLDLFRSVKTEVIAAQTHAECPFRKIVEVATVERSAGNNPLYNVALLLHPPPASPRLGAGIEAESFEVHSDAALLDLRFEAFETEQGIEIQCEYKVDLFRPETIESFLRAFQISLSTLTQSPDVKLKDSSLLETLPRKTATGQTVVVAATFTAEPLEEPLSYWLDELQIPANVNFAPFQQVFQQLLDPTSALATNQRGLNVLLIRLHDWQPNLARNADDFVRATETAAARGGPPILICFCPPPRKASHDPAEQKKAIEVETALSSRLGKLPGVRVTTTRQLAARFPLNDYDDPAADNLGHIPYTAAFFTTLATLVARNLHPTQRPPCKVIALDCDQTLWSGVCGEDGPRGIGMDAPRVALQEFMRHQHEAGKLLVLCSKNDEADVRAVFEQRTDLPLRQNHFAATRINWRPKSQNLRELAQELNLGLDSFVLIDDNPLECAEVEANCPEALALQLPDDPAQIPQFLEHCWVFDQGSVTTEDRNRTDMYRREREREQFRGQTASFASFIEGLELQVEIVPANDGQLGRLAQLTQRTNQFNASGQRRTEAEVRALDGRYEIFAVSVEDRFGDYGLVGAMITAITDDALEVDSFLLSCRALGRGVEHQMLAELGRIASRKALKRIDLAYTPLPRNQPALEFLEGVGASFKQPRDAGAVYRFPTPIAVGIKFEAPQSAPLPAAVQPEKGNSCGTPSRKFAKCREVALDCSDMAQVHEKIESRKAVRPGSLQDYVPPRTELERALCALWQKLLRVERVGAEDDFFRLGGHSLLAVRLFAEMEKLTGKRLPLVTLFQAPTVGKFANLLEENDLAQSTLAPLQPNGTKPPLYLIHGAGGDVLWGYANLVAHMDPDQPIYALKSRGQTGLGEFSRLEEMAAFYLEAIRAHQPEGPYCLGGYCFGGNVAYEMARQLEAQGETIALLALLDAAPANAGYETVQWWRPEFPWLFARNLGFWIRDFCGIKPEDRRRFLARKLRSSARKIAHWFQGHRAAEEVDLEEVIDPAHFPERELALWKIHLKALEEHVQGPYSGRVTLFRTSGNPILSSYARDMRWGRLAAGGVEVHLVPGSHENIFLEPHVKSLAVTLTNALAGAQTQSTRHENLHHDLV